jgi:hypothetical protein
MPSVLLQGGFECPACTREREKRLKNPLPPPDPKLYLDGIRVDDSVFIESGLYAGNDADVKGIDHDTEELIVRVVKGRRDDYRSFMEGVGWVTGPSEYLMEGTTRIAVERTQLIAAICDGRIIPRKRHAKLYQVIEAMAADAGADAKPFELPDLTGQYPREQ